MIVRRMWLRINGSSSEELMTVLNSKSAAFSKRLSPDSAAGAAAGELRARGMEGTYRGRYLIRRTSFAFPGTMEYSTLSMRDFIRWTPSPPRR